MNKIANQHQTSSTILFALKTKVLFLAKLLFLKFIPINPIFRLQLANSY